MIIYAVAVAIGFFLLAYSIRIFRAPFYSIALKSVGVVDALLLKIDEDEKVQLVQKRNNQLIVALLKVIGVIFLSIAIGSIPIILFLLFTGKGQESIEFSSTASIIALTVGSSIGFFVPLKKKQKSEGYSELSQLLHRMALNHYALSYRLYKMEAKKLPKRGVNPKNQYLIISGLARAGTTSLMNKLVENSAFASLSYANMPFLTAPNYWSRIYKPKDKSKKERSHKDGIMIGLDSFEALEEYFFKVIANDSYISEESVNVYELTDSEKSDYLNYQAVVRSSDDKIYLAKNNNFLLRYQSLRATNKEFIAVFMFREPLTHAASLLEKHKEFSASQKEDPFFLEYMNWLGHHEFGLNQKHFQFDEKDSIKTKDKLSLDYWLEVWINYYSYLLTIDRKGALFIDYNAYCENPKTILAKIFQSIGVNDELQLSPRFINNRKVDLPYTDELLQKANEIHSQLKELGDIPTLN